MRNKLIIAAVLIVLVVIVLVARGKQDREDVVSETPNPSAEIQMTATGFNPASLTVKKDTQVIFRNMDTKPHWPESDLPGLDSLQGIAPSQTYSYTFSQLGVWNYKDHLNKKFTGSITVTE